MKHEIKIDYVTPESIIPYPGNTKKHPDSEIEKLAAMIEAYGFDQPIVVDKDMVIIKGHGRLLAHKKLGSELIPIVMRDDLSPALVKASRIADNKSNESEWDLDLLSIEFEDLKELDFDLELTGFDLDEIDALMPEEIPACLTDEDEVPEPPVNPVTNLGDVWLCGKHRVMCGDSTSIDAVEKLMDGKKADMVFTDPPYGVCYASKNEFLNKLDKGNLIQVEIKNDHMSLDETSDFILQAFCNLKLALADRACYYITAPQGGDLLMMMMVMMMAGLPLRHCLIWVKNNHVLGRSDYNYKHEPILYGWDKVHDFYGNGEHKFSTWEIKKPLKNDLHPTMKPIELIENACLNSTKKYQLVLDIFAGSGSTLIACEKTNRINYSMELDEKYCDVIVKRWQDYTGKLANLESTGELFNDLACQ